jgi:hypothetical protein
MIVFEEEASAERGACEQKTGGGREDSVFDNFLIILC